LWNTTRQPTVSLSSTDVEYKAHSNLGQELIAWFANLILQLHVNYTPSNIPVGMENQGEINLARSEISQNSFKTLGHMAPFCLQASQDKTHYLEVNPYKHEFGRLPHQNNRPLHHLSLTSSHWRHIAT
jgi:hypothetical protein